MTNRIEQGLRDLFVEDADRYDTTIAREAILAAIARPKPKRRALWPAIGAGGTAAAGIVVALVLSATGASPAYAGWTAKPTAATASAIRTASHICANGSIGTNSAAYHQAFSQPPVLNETRGLYTTVVEVSAGKLYSCVTGGHPEKVGGPGFRDTGYGHISRPAGPGLITAPYSMKSAFGGGLHRYGRAPGVHGSPSANRIFVAEHEDGGYGPSAIGQTGPDVTAVSFAFKNGQTVSATLQDGWYFAWWPWIGYPTSVSVTTSNGTNTSPMTTRGDSTVFIVPACKPGSASCAFSGATNSKATPKTTSSSAGAPSP